MIHRPMMKWDSDDSYASDVVWWSRLDGRYQIEVQRSDDYRGLLCIFDHANHDRLLHTRPVALSFGAIFGPDVDDIASWRDLSSGWVDKNMGPEAA